MKTKPLLIFDLDGVIIDGMDEYWHSSRQACINLLGGELNNYLTNEIPEAFKYLRPWVQHGWEMVLITAELTRPESYLISEGWKKFAKHYSERCKEALEIWQWHPRQIQQVLDKVRTDQINKNLNAWLAKHECFSGIPDRINELQKEENDIAILTTKGAEFTGRLLKLFQIKSNLLYGHESGSKIDVLTQISQDRTILGFIEDRRATLEKVLKTPGLNSIPCFLASWGYLKPNDSKNLPQGIYLLEQKTFTRPLANWN